MLLSDLAYLTFNGDRHYFYEIIDVKGVRHPKAVKGSKKSTKGFDQSAVSAAAQPGSTVQFLSAIHCCDEFF